MCGKQLQSEPGISFGCIFFTVNHQGAKIDTIYGFLVEKRRFPSYSVYNNVPDIRPFSYDFISQNHDIADRTITIDHKIIIEVKYMALSIFRQNEFFAD